MPEGSSIPEKPQGPSRVDPRDQAIEAEERAERAQNSKLAEEVKKDREANQGMSDADVSALADKFLKEHGSGSLVEDSQPK